MRPLLRQGIKSTPQWYIRVLCASVFALLFLVDPIRACDVPKHRWGSYETTITIAVRMNETNCSSRIRYNGPGTIESLALKRPASHGKAGAVRPYVWAYVPNRNFTGQDNFSLLIRYTDQGKGKIETATINVIVNVNP